MAKEQGLEIGRTEFEGMFMKHVIGGQQAVGPYKNWFNTVIGDKFDNQFRIEAELDYEHGVQNLMAQDKTLTRQTATQRLAQDFSGQYVKLMNNKISDTQSKVDEIDNVIRAAKLSNPKGLSADKAKQMQELLRQKNDLQDGVKKLKTEKGTDQDFQKKAVDLYLANPAGTYMGKIKDDYATQFAISKATTKVDTEYKANEVALQKDRQSFEWSKMLKQAEINDAHDIKMKMYDWEIAKATAELKGETKGQAMGAMYGNPTDAGSYTLDYAYRQSVSNDLNTAVKGYTNDKVLAVAANLEYASGIKTTANDGLNMSLIKTAINNTANGKQLNQSESEALATYLSKVRPGFKFDPNKHSFADIQTVIDAGFGANRNNNPKLAGEALVTLQGAGNALASFSSKYSAEQGHLKGLYTNPNYRPFITYTNGMYGINYTALKTHPEYMDQVIPNSGTYKNAAAVQTRTIELHPADPTKMDASVYRNIIENATMMGVTNSKGGFDKFDKDDVGKLRNIALGDENLKNVFDTGVEYQLTIVDNQPVWKVTMPVKKIMSGDKPASAATKFGIDIQGKAGESNKIEFYVPASNTDKISGSDAISINPITKQKSVLKNDLKALLEETMRGANIAPPLSWVTNNGLANDKDGVSVFPSYLAGRIGGGQITHSGNDILMDFIKLDGTRQHLNYTDISGTSYGDYIQNPLQYDGEIKTYVETLVNDYSTANINAAIVNHQIKNNTSNPNLVPWDKILKP